MNISHIITDLLDENKNFKDEINILKRRMHDISVRIGNELLKKDDKFKKYYEEVRSTFEEYGKNGMFRNYLDDFELKKHLDDLTKELKMGYYEIVSNMLKDKFGYDFKFSLWTDGYGIGDFTFYRPISETSVFWNGSGWTENIYHTDIDEDSDDENENEYDNENDNEDDEN
jgi:hypothetical protein